jgi:protocatechuate 3,4-dioxygenase beta subunit
MPETEDHDHDAHDGGLAVDLPVLMGRRRALQCLGGIGLVTLVGCATSGGDGGGTAVVAADTGTAIPQETGGPFPGDGSNGPNVLPESGVVRSDITTSFGGYSGRAEGVPLAIDLTVVEAGSGAPLPGATVYVWHCTREGGYSLYSEGVTDQNYLRGVQEAGADGRLGFTSIFPAAYDGRWPHIHFEVYESLDAATAAQTKLRTSQLAIPQEACDAVYATTGYEQSVQNLAQTSLDSDMVFSDGFASQLATATGSVDDGYTLALNVGV